MKAYIGNIDWADEWDVFFFSVENVDFRPFFQNRNRYQ